MIYERGYIAGADGNVSVRVDADRVLVTPSGRHKGFLEPRDLVMVAADGTIMEGARPTSELGMHLEIYRRRADVRAVVHAHPPHVVALSLAGVSLATHTLPELVFQVGSVRHAGYATPTTDEVVRAIRKPIQERDAVVLDRHGTVTVGRNLQEAFNLLETIEHTARIVWLARAIGPVHPLPAAEVERLCRLAGRVDCS